MDRVFAMQAPLERAHAAQLAALREDVKTLAMLAEGRLNEKRAAEDARVQAERRCESMQAR
eukprot:5470499-Pleurochrysis_carterae.AAC.1